MRKNCRLKPYCRSLYSVRCSTNYRNTDPSKSNPCVIIVEVSSRFNEKQQCSLLGVKILYGKNVDSKQSKCPFRLLFDKLSKCTALQKTTDYCKNVTPLRRGATMRVVPPRNRHTEKYIDLIHARVHFIYRSTNNRNTRSRKIYENNPSVITPDYYYSIRCYCDYIAKVSLRFNEHEQKKTEGMWVHGGPWRCLSNWLVVVETFETRISTGTALRSATRCRGRSRSVENRAV